MDVAPQLTWEIGTAYDLFTSLDVIHNPARYGLRGSWAAGVRSRLPLEQREFLQNSVEHHHFWAIPWLTNLDGPKDGATVLQKLADIPQVCRAEQPIRNGMGEDIRVGMADEALVVRNGHAAQYQRVARCEPVQVVALAYSHPIPFDTKASATWMSLGRVTLRLCGDPGTSFTAWPQLCTSVASSVLRNPRFFASSWAFRRRSRRNVCGVWHAQSLRRSGVSPRNPSPSSIRIVSTTGMATVAAP